MDGNARVKRGVSAMCTTFGVGELSALNGVGVCLASSFFIHRGYEG